MSPKEILKIYGIEECPEIILEGKDNKILDGELDIDQNTITIWNHKGSHTNTLLHELSHYILYKQGKSYLNHTKAFHFLEAQLNELQRDNK